MGNHIKHEQLQKSDLFIDRNHYPYNHNEDVFQLTIKFASNHNLKTKLSYISSLSCIDATIKKEYESNMENMENENIEESSTTIEIQGHV